MVKNILLILMFFITVSTFWYTDSSNSIVIQKQGSFAAGGKILQNKGTFDVYNPAATTGQTLHGDHAYVFYQIPQKARKYPLVFLHGADQSARTWETTPDGREGFQNIFLRRKYSVYLIDQPRRGRAGQSTVEQNIKPVPNDQLWYGQFRIGLYPQYFEGSQFPKGEESLNQFFRQITPNTGPYNARLISDTVAGLFDITGEGILVTHSQGGGSGWLAAIKNPKIKAIAAFEPGSGFVFPEGEAPETIPTKLWPISAVEISKEDFMKLTRIPIVIYFGDNIPAEISDIPNLDSWRVRLQMAKLWADAVNRHGGDVEIVHLPEIGIKGNTHFLFSDLNNLEIADLLENFLKKKGLD